MSSNAWLFAAIVSSSSWAIADIACDVCIEEHGDEDHGSDDGRPDTREYEMTSIVEHELNRTVSKRSVGVSAHLHKEPSDGSEAGDPEPNDSSKRDDNDADDDDEDEEMSGEQDCAVAGLVTMVIVYSICLQRWTNFSNAQLDPFSRGSTRVFVWSPFHDSEWWLAAVSGVFLFCHYLLLLWAYDHAPSTVINPLLQVSSTWVLIGSAVPALLTGRTFITPTDLVCYMIITVGGLIPSLKGNFRMMLTAEFYKQPFVKFTFLSEFTVGMYDLLLAYVLQNAVNSEVDADPAILENEFFFIAWCWFTIAFSLSFALHPRMSKEFSGLSKLPKKVLIISACGQLMTMFGYYVSQFAYSWYYQASIVHAAESSMGQGFNLVFAFMLKKGFNVGRASAVSDMKVKILSVIVVSVGLFLIAWLGHEKPS